MPSLLSTLAAAPGPLAAKAGVALGLVFALVALEAAASLALRGLRLGGRGRIALLRAALAVIVPLAVVAPRLEGDEILAPTHSLRAAPGVADLGPGPWDILSDAVFQFLPWEIEVRRAFDDGRLPLWSDVLQASPWSNPQAQALSPVAAVARLFPIGHFLLAALAVKLLVGFDGAWALAAACGARWPFRALAAAGFVLGGGFAAWAVFPQSTALASVPWLAACALRLARRPGAGRFAATALATAALALAGHPEVAAAGGVLAAWIAWALRRRRLALLSTLGRLALAAALGLAVAAPHLLPFAFEARESQRFAELAAGRPAPDLATLRGWFPEASTAYLLAPFGPEVFGRPFFGTFRGPYNWVAAASGYAGLAALGGAAAALAARRARRRALPFLLFALVSFAAAARFGPLEAAASRLPVLRAMALERALLPATLALAIAGALGAERLARRGGRGAWIALAAAAGVSLAAAATPRTVATWLLLALAARLATRRRAVAATALVAALALDLALFFRDFVPAGFVRQLYPPSALADELARRAAGEPFRIAGLGTDAYPASLAPLGLEDARVHDPLADERYLEATGAAFGFHPTTTEYFSPFARPDHPLAARLGIRFVLARGAANGPAGWDVLRHPAEPRWIAFENPRPASRVFVEDGGAGDRVTIVARRDGRLDLAVALARARPIGTSLLEPEDWRIAPRGAAAVTAGGPFLSWTAPPGVRRLVLERRPAGLAAGWALAVTGALGLALASRARPRGAPRRRA